MYALIPFLVAAVVAVGTVCAIARADILSSKRGFADVGASYDGLQATNAGWYYTWGTGPANPGNFDANFYPMFWNAPSQSTINTALGRNPIYMLGFNEPERTDQANMTVTQAITSWTAIANSTKAYNTAHGTNIKLVSPAVADTGGATGGQQWLANFMSQANASGLKVDAVAFHWYDISSPTDPVGAANQFLSRVDSYHNSYGLPVFITEFAIHDWGGTYPVSQMIDANRQFLNIVIPGLESRSYVAGYSWYNWFNDSALFGGSPLTPTPMSYGYIGAVTAGNTANVGGVNLGEHVADLAGGTLTMTGSAGSVKYINALANTSTITGSIDWALSPASAGNWVRVQPGATLLKGGSNRITFDAGTLANDGVIQVAQGVLRLGVGASGAGSINISSTGDAVGSTARIELTGNISVPQPITFAQRSDPGASDGIRNVSGNNTLSGRMTITSGGSQARIQSDAGTLTLAGAITTDYSAPRNLYLQGAGNGVVSGAISDNAGNAGGKINLIKAGTGTWTITAPNAYTGTTTISGGVLRLGQTSADAVASAAVANYSFDSANGSTVVNGGTGGAAMNGTLANGATIVPGGRFGNAVSLANGASVNINNPIADLGPASNWTVAAWVKTTTAGASILTKGDGTHWSSGNTIFYLGGGSGPGSGGIPGAVRWGGGFFQGSSSASAVSDNAWHQITYVNSAGSYAIYVDGVAQSLASYNSSFSNADVGSVVRLGVSTDTVAGDGAVNFNGLLDGVQFYKQALSPQQVAALYNGGTLAGQLPSSTAVSIAAGATLDLNGVDQTIDSLTGPAGAAVTLGGGTLTMGNAASSEFDGSISGDGGVTVQGTGSVTLGGTNSYTGPTTVVGGAVLKVASDANLGAAAGALILNRGSLLATADLATARPVQLGLGGGTLDAVAGATLTLAGPITGVGSLTKGPAPGTLTLAQAGGLTLAKLNAGGGTVNVGDPAVGLTGPLSVNGALTINANANVKLIPSAAPITNNFVKQLTIAGNGLLDIGNHFLQLDNAVTPEADVRQYLHNGYNADPTTGIGNWLGTGGITSSDAIAAHNGANPSFKISIGYVNGAYASDPLINGPIPGQESLASNRILIRPALYGDLNLDGKVDDTDLAIFSGLGMYNQPTDRFGWLGGDLNHDGKVDDTDLQIFSGAGNYNGPTYGSAATPTLTRASASGGGTTQGAIGDGVLDLVYDPSTGDVKVFYDGDSRISAANPLQVIRFKSAGAHFLPANFNASGFSNVTTDNSTLNGTILGAASLPDGYDLGAILATGLTISDLTSDLTLQWNVSGGGLALKNGDILIPEPVALAVIALGAVGLRGRRCHRH